jgi:DNA-binding cell septation regulator SpoVG
MENVVDHVISEVYVCPVKPKDGLVGFASFTLYKSFYVSSIGIWTRPTGGYRLTYPGRGGLNICHPVTKELGKQIEEAVSDKIEEILLRALQNDNQKNWEL